MHRAAPPLPDLPVFLGLDEGNFPTITARFEVEGGALPDGPVPVFLFNGRTFPFFPFGDVRFQSGELSSDKVCVGVL